MIRYRYLEKKSFHRMVSVLMVVALVLATVPLVSTTQAEAATESCTHDCVDGTCSYVPGVACDHEHDADCGGLQIVPLPAAISINIEGGYENGGYENNGDLYLDAGVKVTDAMLLQGSAATDENGDLVEVVIEDIDELDRQSPVLGGTPGNPQSYTIIYETIHPVADEDFTATREAYVPAGIMPLANWNAGNSATLVTALTNSVSGDTITLTASFTHTSAIVINSKNITLNLNGYTLTVNAALAGVGLEVSSGGSLILQGNGAFNITGTYMGTGVKASDNATAEVTNVTSALYGAYASYGGSVKVYGDVVATGSGSTGAIALGGGTVMVGGNVQAGYYGAYAEDIGSTIVVSGNVIATKSDSFGAFALDGGSVTVGGKAQGVYCGVYAEGASSAIAVTGDAVATGQNSSGDSYGTYARSGGSVTVGGNAQATDYGVAAYNAGSTVYVAGNVTGKIGADAYDGGKITIDGAISATTRYILVGNASQSASGYDSPPPNNTGYRTYTDGASVVKVKGIAPKIDNVTAGTDTINLTEGYATGNTRIYAIDGDNVTTKNISITGTNTADASVSSAGLLTIPTGLTAAGSPYTTTITAVNGVYPSAKMTVIVNVSPAASNPVCEIVETGVQYDNLDDALAAAQDGETIILLDDLVLSTELMLDRNTTYTLDLGGYTVSRGIYLFDYLFSITAGTVTLKNGTLNNNITGGIRIDNAAVTLDALVITADYATSIAVAAVSGTVSILSGTYIGGDDAVYASSGTVTITSGTFTATDSFGDGCLVTGSSGTVALATGSVADVANWLNDAAAVTVTVATSSPICEIVETGVQYATLDDALAAVQDSETIKLLDDIVYNDILFFEDWGFTFDVNGFTLSIEADDYWDAAFTVHNVEIALIDSGTGGAFNVTNINANGMGVYVDVGAKVTVTNVSGTKCGVYAHDGKIVVRGNVLVSGSANTNYGAYAAAGGTVIIDGVITIPSGATYIRVGTTDKTATDITTPTTKSGYLTYTDGTNTVWVKETASLIPVASIFVAGGTAISIPGGTLQLTANVLPATATNKTVTWSIAGGSGATVNSTGLVTATGNGSVTIRATADDGSGVYGELSLVVSGQTVPPATYTLTVVNGMGGGSYAAGTQVSVTANPAPSGKVFDCWTGGDGGVFDNTSNATTTFTMPANNAAVTATYKPDGGANSGDVRIPGTGDAGNILLWWIILGLSASGLLCLLIRRKWRWRGHDDCKR